MEFSDIQLLEKWFLNNARDMPWRENSTPYAVWVSEVMLQQTQVSVVIPYFMRWMERFPTINALAEAPEADVIKLWEGLGYYARARNLHAGAKQVLSQFNGQIPSCPIQLQSIKGLGPYTIGAIRAFAFKQKASAVDGNVLRVLARYYHIEDEITRPKVIEAIRDKADKLLPDQKPWIITEALIELGATVCSRVPKCVQCPLKNGCLAFERGNAAILPKKKPRPEITILHRLVGIIVHNDFVMLKKGKEGKLMGGLYTFPFIELENENDIENHQLLIKKFNLEAIEIKKWQKTKHGFTRYQANLYPFLIVCSKAPNLQDNHEWIKLSTLSNCSFPSGHRDIASKLPIT